MKEHKFDLTALGLFVSGLTLNDWFIILSIISLLLSIALKCVQIKKTLKSGKTTDIE